MNMKKIREYPWVDEDDWAAGCHQKTTLKPTEQQLFWLEEAEKEGRFHAECMDMLNLYEWYQGPGGRFERYYFHLTKKRRYLTVTHYVGLDI